MATRAASTVGAPSKRGLRVIESMAWRVPLSSRRFFLAVAFTAAGAVVAGSLIAALVSARNAEAVADARDRRLRIASSVTEFRDHLSAADGEVAAELVSGEAMSPLGRSRYETELLGAGPSLTAAGLVAEGASAEDIRGLAEGLARYADLVETSRAYPVGSTFVDLARNGAREELVPTADRVRTTAERQMTDAAERGGGPASAVAGLCLLIALAVLVMSAVLVAGRTRRLLDPLLMAAVAILAANGGVVGTGLWSQSRQLRAAASVEIDAYVASNANAFALLDLRVEEVDAVALGNGDPFYAQFRRDAEVLLDRIAEDPTNAGVLLPAVRAYSEAVAEVETLDARGDNGGAAVATLQEDSDLSYGEARRVALDTVNRSATELEGRLDAAAGADVEPLVPIGLGIASAASAMAGVLTRGKRYR